MKKKLEIMMAVLFLVFSAVIGRVSAECVAKAKGAETDKNGDTICICVDAGHGGTDPGKVGVNNIEEKEINLQIAKKLRTSLEKQGFQVVMTRTGEADLSEAGADNAKVSDMRNRVAFIKKKKATFTVSIHQNSYTAESAHGAQVFYYSESAEGKKLAEHIQASLKALVDGENTREVKANNSYYMLKKTPTPTVIVECGFLSNYEEAQQLCQDDYQQQLATGITAGVCAYLKTVPDFKSEKQ